MYGSLPRLAAGEAVLAATGSAVALCPECGTGGGPGAPAGVDQPGLDVRRGGIGLWQGLSAGSVSLTGWALGSAVEGLASVIVVWRFTGSRMLSQTAERRAQRGVPSRSG